MGLRMKTGKPHVEPGEAWWDTCSRCGAEWPGSTVVRTEAGDEYCIYCAAKEIDELRRRLKDGVAEEKGDGD